MADDDYLEIPNIKKRNILEFLYFAEYKLFKVKIHNKRLERLHKR